MYAVHKIIGKKNTQVHSTPPLPHDRTHTQTKQCVKQRIAIIFVFKKTFACLRVEWLVGKCVVVVVVVQFGGPHDDDGLCTCVSAVRLMRCRSRGYLLPKTTLTAAPTSKSVSKCNIIGAAAALATAK